VPGKNNAYDQRLVIISSSLITRSESLQAVVLMLYHYIWWYKKITRGVVNLRLIFPAAETLAPNP
jgi:hypothetical protein